MLPGLVRRPTAAVVVEMNRRNSGKSGTLGQIHPWTPPYQGSSLFVHTLFPVCVSLPPIPREGRQEKAQRPSGRFRFGLTTLSFSSPRGNGKQSVDGNFGARLLLFVPVSPAGLVSVWVRREDGDPREAVQGPLPQEGVAEKAHPSLRDLRQAGRRGLGR